MISTTIIPARIRLPIWRPTCRAQSVGQNRTLTNAGIRPEISYVKGINNLKIGAVYQQTFLNENDSVGIVDPTFNAPCLDSNGNPFWTGTSPSSPNDPSQCAGLGLQPNDGVVNPNIAAFNPLLGCYDLTRPTPSSGDGCPSATSGLFDFRGHTDVKELALYVRDIITKGNWSLNLGLRGDFYNGLVTHKEAEPRLGIAYNIKQTNTVLRVSYARVLETPFNENLVLSSTGCDNAVLNPLLGCSAANPTPSRSRVGATSFTLDWSRHSASTWSFLASTSGSTRTTLMTSASSARPPLRFRSPGIGRRFLGSPVA